MKMNFVYLHCFS